MSSVVYASVTPYSHCQAGTAQSRLQAIRPSLEMPEIFPIFDDDEDTGARLTSTQSRLRQLKFWLAQSHHTDTLSAYSLEAGLHKAAREYGFKYFAKLQRPRSMLAQHFSHTKQASIYSCRMLQQQRSWTATCPLQAAPRCG